MRTFFMTVVMLAIASSGSAAWYGPAPDPKLNGVLVERMGSVEVANAKGKPVKASAGTELKSGTRIKAAEGGSATVMLMDGTVVKVAGGETYIVGSVPRRQDKKTVIEGIAVAFNEAARVKLPAATTTDVKTSQQEASPRVRGMVKMGRLGPGTPRRVHVNVGAQKKKTQKRAIRNGPMAVYPVNTAIRMPKEIEFKWKSKVNFAKPIVVLEGTGIKRMTVEIPGSPGTRVRASTGALGLKRGGKYNWYLASLGDSAKKKRSGTYSFRILTDEAEDELGDNVKRVDKVAESTEGRALLRAQLLFNHGMYQEMVETLLPVWQKEKSPAVKKLLKLGYAKMGLWDQARQYR